MKTAFNFNSLPLGTKVQSYDLDGYYVMNACGFIAKHLTDGHAIIKTFSGEFVSTVSLLNIAEVELLS